MSSQWVDAGKRWHGYTEPQATLAPPPDGKPSRSVSNLVTRAVMRELCLIAHDCGAVQVTHREIASRIGVSPAVVKRAIARLQADGLLATVKRGSGSTGRRTGSDSLGKVNSPNVYLLARLPDPDGYLWPASVNLYQALMGGGVRVPFVMSRRYACLPVAAQVLLVRMAADWYGFGELPESVRNRF